MIAEFITHLKANVSPSVDYAWTSDPVEETHEDIPVVFVYPGDYSGDPSEYDNIVRQQIQQSVVCMFGCEVDKFEAIRNEIHAAAIGWTFENYDAFELLSGETLGINGGIIWIQETYTTRYLLTEG